MGNYGCNLQTNDAARRELHLRIGFVTGSKFKDEAGVDCAVHDTIERQWQHLNFFEHIVSYIAKYRASPPVKARCEQSMCRGHGHKVASRFYSRHLLGLIEREMPVIRVAQILGVHPQRIWTVFDHWVGKARANGSQLNQASWRRRGIE